MLEAQARILALTLLAAAAMTGCSTAGNARGYLADRFGDVLDIFGLQFAVGPSAYAEVQVGRYIHLPIGLAVGGTDWIGLIDGHFKQQPAPATYGFPCANAFVVATIAADPMMEFDATLLACLFCTKVVDAGNDGYLCLCFVPARMPSSYDRSVPASRWFDISAEISLVARVRITFSPGEALDFLIGLLGTDLTGDDHRPEPPSAHTSEPTR